MLLYWNNLRWNFDATASTRSPPGSYVFIRKIFVGGIETAHVRIGRLSAPSFCANFSFDFQRKLVRSFVAESVPIESIEFLDPSSDENLRVYYAAVARKAAKNTCCRKCVCYISILPAYTWKQPDYREQDDEITLSRLNDDVRRQKYSVISTRRRWPI